MVSAMDPIVRMYVIDICTFDVIPATVIVTCNARAQKDDGSEARKRSLAFRFV